MLGDQIQTARQRMHFSNLGGILPVRISSFQPDKQSFMESKEREGSSSIDNSGMANPTLVCHVTSDVSRTSNSPSKNKGSFEGPKWSYTPTSSGEVAKVSGLECFRQSLVAEGISKRASELIGNCRRQGTFLLMNRPGESGLAGVVTNKLIQFTVL